MNKKMKQKQLISSKRARHLSLRNLGLVAIVLLIGAITAVSVQRAGSTGATVKESPPPASKGADSNYLAASLVKRQAQVDPQTGQVRPLTQDEAQQLAAGIKELVNQSSDGLNEVQNADGSVSVDLQGRFQNVAVAKTAVDGSLAQSCVDNPDSAAVFFGIDPQLLNDPSRARSRNSKSAK